mgnify:CR=1
MRFFGATPLRMTGDAMAVVKDEILPLRFAQGQNDKRGAQSDISIL